MIQHYGPKEVTREEVKRNYEKIVSDCYFININLESSSKQLAEAKAREDVKKIDSRMASLLMLLGLSDLSLLSKILRGSHDFPELTSEDEWEIYCKCDGFGKLSSDELKGINGGFDWSHVRDSSDEATLEAESLLIDKLVAIYNNYKAKE